MPNQTSDRKQIIDLIRAALEDYCPPTETVKFSAPLTLPSNEKGPKVITPSGHGRISCWGE